MSSPSPAASTALQPNASAPSPRLVTLAILKANWNDGKSYLDNFVPFVAECLRDAAGPLDVKQLQTAMRKSFGMRIPQHTLETVLRRARDQKLVERADGLYHPDRDALAGAVSPSQGEFLRCHKALVSQLQTFAKDRYNRDLTETEAAAGLDAYVDEFGAPILVRGAAAERAFDPAVVADPNTSFIVHAFVEYVSAADPAGFKYLATVVEGSMLASVVYLPDAGSVQRKFKDSTTVYLDTPFLLRALGHLGPELAAPAIELLELLRDYGARIACFDKTVTELRGVILNAARQVGTRASGSSTDVTAHFAQRGLRRADVEIIAADLEPRMSKLGISVLATPAYTANSNVDETELEEVLANEVRYQHDKALRHDLDALTAVDRLRRGQSQPILESCRAVFLTTNAPLVRAARKYFDDDGQGFNWPPAILDTDLATIIWLKKPMKAPDLPRKQIMADCYATLRPNAAVWDRWLDEIVRTTASGNYSDAHLDYIRFSPDAQRMLMDLTLGDASAIESATVDQVVAAAEKQITGPVADQLAATADQLEQERAQRRHAEDEAAAATVRADAEAAARAAVEETFRRKHDERLANLHARAARRSQHVGQVLFGILVLIFVGSAVLAVVGSAPFLGSSVASALRVAGGVLWLVTTFVGLAGMGWGIDARKLVGHVEKWLEPKLYRRYLRSAGELS